MTAGSHFPTTKQDKNCAKDSAHFLSFHNRGIPPFCDSIKTGNCDIRLLLKALLP